MLSARTLTMDLYKDRTSYDLRSSNNELISTVTSYSPDEARQNQGQAVGQLDALAARAVHSADYVFRCRCDTNEVIMADHMAPWQCSCQ